MESNNNENFFLELPKETRTFLRIIKSLQEEAEAIAVYEKRICLENNLEAKAIFGNAQAEEMKHFSMDLEFLLREKNNWYLLAKHIVMQDGDIVQNAEKAEEHLAS
jgi:hypothetical protein